MTNIIQIIVVIVAAFVAVLYSTKNGLLSRKISEVVHGKPGCVPIADVGNVTLHYFAGRGRAEIIRLILAESGVPYTEKNFDKDSWPAHKRKGTQDGLYTFGQVPAIETTHGLTLVQSHPIAQYLGRSLGLDCNCEDLTLCDVIAHGVEDAGSKMGKMVYNPSFSLKDKNEYLTETLPMWLGYFEKLAPPLVAQDKPYFASGRLTWVDFLVFDLLEKNVEFGRYDFGASEKRVEVLASFPKLNTFYQHFSKRPHIANYINSKKRFPFKLPNLPK